MWALIATGILAVWRHRWRLSPRMWRCVHVVLAGLIVGGTVAHVMLIEGTMEITSKVILCLLVSGAWVMVARGQKR